MRIGMTLALLWTGLLVAGGCDHDTRTPDIGLLVKYAQQFRPCTTDGDCRNLYRTPEEIRDILKKHVMTDAYKASVMLVLLRQYNYEYDKFHQGYEIRNGMFHRQSAFVEAYIRITGDHGGDHMTARVAYDWVNGHPEYLQHELIAAEMDQVRQTERSIVEMNSNEPGQDER